MTGKEQPKIRFRPFLIEKQNASKLINALVNKPSELLLDTATDLSKSVYAVTPLSNLRNVFEKK
jgi:hypothetical protein